MAVTFHRAFDLTRDPVEALDTLIALGVERLLTSGQALSALAARRRSRPWCGRRKGGSRSWRGRDQRSKCCQNREGDRGDGNSRRGDGNPTARWSFGRDEVFMGKPHQPDEYRRVETDFERVRSIVERVSGER